MVFIKFIQFYVFFYRSDSLDFRLLFLIYLIHFLQYLFLFKILQIHFVLTIKDRKIHMIDHFNFHFIELQNY